MEPNESSEMNTYPHLFVNFVINSVQATLASIDPQAPFLNMALRERTKHVLDYAMRVDEAWPITKTLILRVAPKMEQAGHRDDWMSYLEKALLASQCRNDPQCQAELSLLIGELLRLRGNFALAKERFQASVDYFIDLDDNQGWARALNQLSFVAWQQQACDEAEQLAEHALRLLDEKDPERATCFSRLGLVALVREQWEKAEQLHRDALQIRQAYGNQRLIAWSQQNLGYALRGQEKHTAAIEYYEQAIDILKRIRDVANCANVQVNLGIAYSLSGQPIKALEMYAMAEPIYRKLSDKYMLARIYTNRGIELSTLHKWMEAEAAFVISINLSREIGDTGWRLNTLDGLGGTYLGQGKTDKAIATYERILNEINCISGTPMYIYLSNVVPDHLQRARAENVKGQHIA